MKNPQPVGRKSEAHSAINARNISTKTPKQ
jgi:hypothetical protein